MSESPLKSSLLVAMPQLLDPNFRRSVVLLVHHDEEGTFGLVLNRPVELSVKELCSEIECKWGGPSDEAVFSGGPVQTNTGWVLFERGGVEFDPEYDGITEVGDHLLFAGSIEVLKAVAEAPPTDTRLFIGYAGWGPGQLEDELTEGAWLVTPLSCEAIFDVQPEDMWTFVVESLGIDPATLIATRGVH